MILTEAQRQALQDLVLCEDAYRALVRRGELLVTHRPGDPKLDPLSATIADVGEAADKALDKVLEEFGA